MKNRLKNIVSLITAIVFAFLFAGLVGGGDGALTASLFVTSLVASFVLAQSYTKASIRKMSFVCGALTAGFTVDCENPLASGINSTFRIANKADIESVTYDPANAMLCTDITMKTGKRFWTFEGQLQSTEPKVNGVKGKYINQFEHSVSFLVFNLSPATKLQLLNLKDGNYVCLIENNYTGTDGNAKYEVYGLGSGLKFENFERNVQDAETLGAFKIELKTQEYARESKPAVTFFDTDLATTEAAVLALDVP
jgi:hypothetical protein